MNRREVFEKVKAWPLRPDFKRSVSISQMCAYRGTDGNKCAIGLLIPDELYTPEMEGHTVRALVKAFPFLRGVLSIENDEDLEFLTKLQITHDVAYQENADEYRKEDLNAIELVHFPVGEGHGTVHPTVHPS